VTSQGKSDEAKSFRFSRVVDRSRYGRIMQAFRCVLTLMKRSREASRYTTLALPARVAPKRPGEADEVVKFISRKPARACED